MISFHATVMPGTAGALLIWIACAHTQLSSLDKYPLFPSLSMPRMLRPLFCRMVMVSKPLRFPPYPRIQTPNATFSK